MIVYLRIRRYVTPVEAEGANRLENARTSGWFD